MTRKEELMEKAIQIAQVINREVKKINKTPYKDLSFSTMVAVWESHFTIIPKVKEILIFGSLAKGDENPQDIDMILLDNGFFPDGFLPDGTTRDKYQELSQ